MAQICLICPTFGDWHIFFKKISNHPLSSLNLYQHTKNYPNSSFCPWDIAILKSCNLIGQELFGPYFKNQNFGRHGVCARKTITISFILDHFQPKLMTKFCEIWKKPHFLAYFGPFSPIFRAMRIFLKNPALSPTTSHGFLSPCQKLGKTNDQIPRKLSDRRTDGQTLFHRTLPAWPGVQ